MNWMFITELYNKISGTFTIRTVQLIRRFIFAACMLLTACVTLIFYADTLIIKTTQHLIWNDINTLPYNNVGLVLGAKPGNKFFVRRINTAAALYHAGKVKWLLVSGDNSKKNYDEPSAMQQALIHQGVPEEAIFCDYAGFSTLDSVVRAQKVFGITDMTIISQGFHNPRALWLAREYGIRAIAVNAPDIPQKARIFTHFREKLARVSAVIDAKILHRQPKYLGSVVSIGQEVQRGCPTKN